MSDLISRMGDLLDAQHDGFSPPAPWRVQRAVSNETGRGLVQATRVQANTYVAHARVEAASFVARVGLHRVAELSADAMEFSAKTPLGTGRFQAIADAFASLVADEVIRLGYDR